jgi:protein phosphatase
VTLPGALREFAAATTRGLRRACNEDALAAAGHLITGEVTAPVHGALGAGRTEAFVVSDGVGSRAHGARASREVVTGIVAELASLAHPQGCVDAVRRTNLRLHDVMLRQPETVGMAATVAGVALSGAQACWFNVGDSRVYRMSAAGLEQLSVDDTAAPAGAACATSHTLLRSLGGQRAIAPVRPHVGRGTLTAGDRLLLCSDGLWNMLPDRGIAAILEARREAVAAVQGLLDAALGAGGRDNVSILLVQ